MFDRKITFALASIMMISVESSARGDDAGANATDTALSSQLDAPDSVSHLIEQLGAEEWTTREAASTSLIDFGPSIIHRLQAALVDADDPEVRSRLETAIAQINENELIGASIISLDFVDAPIVEVIDALNRQARCNIIVNLPEPANSRRITLHLERASFWQALNAIEQASGLSFGMSQYAWTLGRQGRAFPSEYTSESGPMQFAAAEYRLIANYADGNSDIGKATLSISIRGEPKVNLAQGKSRIVIEKAVDDLGNDLTDTPELSGVWLNERAFGTANIPLARPRGIGTKIAELSGYVELSLATRIETIQIENLASFQSIERTAGTMKIRIDPVSEAERSQLQSGGLAIKISAIDNVNREQLQQRLNSAINTARVVDSRGRAAGRPSPSYSAGDVPNEFCCLVVFQRGATDPSDVLSLRLDIPMEYRQITTRFSFKDLPLP